MSGGGERYTDVDRQTENYGRAHVLLCFTTGLELPWDGH